MLNNNGIGILVQLKFYHKYYSRIDLEFAKVTIVYLIHVTAISLVAHAIVQCTITIYKHFCCCCSCGLQAGVRDRTTITYNTALGVIFGVKKYAERLLKVNFKDNNITHLYLDSELDSL